MTLQRHLSTGQDYEDTVALTDGHGYLQLDNKCVLGSPYTQSQLLSILTTTPISWNMVKFRNRGI